MYKNKIIWPIEMQLMPPTSTNLLYPHLGKMNQPEFISDRYSSPELQSLARQY